MNTNTLFEILNDISGNTGRYKYNASSAGRYSFEEIFSQLNPTIIDNLWNKFTNSGYDLVRFWKLLDSTNAEIFENYIDAVIDKRMRGNKLNRILNK